MPIKGARYRVRYISPVYRTRLAFVNNRVVEVTGYFHKKGKWVKAYTRRLPKRGITRGSYKYAVRQVKKCMYCGKRTTRRSGFLGHFICSKCARKGRR